MAHLALTETCATPAELLDSIMSHSEVGSAICRATLAEEGTARAGEVRIDPSDLPTRHADRFLGQIWGSPRLHSCINAERSVAM